MKQLTKAILAVMNEVKGIEKNLKVGVGNSAYKGVSDKDVKKVIGESMQKHGLVLIPIDIDTETQVDRWEEERNGIVKNKQQVFTSVKTKYMLLHDSGESMEVAGYGHGVDSQDKSAGKATTYALKNALLYMFLVPTGDIDPEATHSNTIKTPPAQKPEPDNDKPAEKESLTKKHKDWKTVENFVKENTKTDFDKLFDRLSKKYKISAIVKGQLKKIHEA